MAKITKGSKGSTTVTAFFRDSGGTTIFQTAHTIDAGIVFVSPELETKFFAKDDYGGARGIVKSVFRQVFFDSGSNFSEAITIDCSDSTVV